MKEMGTASLSVPDDSGARAAAFEPKAGERLGRYELLCRIASGGMAEVWAARLRGEFGFARGVAVKVIRPEFADSASFRSMFLDEARLAAKIRHPNVVDVLDLGEHGAIIYQAMEYVEGANLAALIDRQRKSASGGARGLPVPIAARIVADFCCGLHAAHELTDEHGAALHLVHRDVSPHNVLVSADGVSKIADFGIAKALGRSSDETDAGKLKGKLSYLSPEQARREPVDRRSDVFSAGIVLWEALTGMRLFRGDDAVDTLRRVADCEIPDPGSVAPVAPELAQVVLRALERDPSRRYATAAELSDAIEGALRGAAIATQKQVGAFVREQLGSRLASDRAAIDAAASAVITHASLSIPVVAGDVPPRWGRSRRVRLGLAAAGSVLAIAGAAAVVLSRSPRAPTHAPGGDTSGAPLPAPALVPSGAPPDVSAIATPSASAASSAPAAASRGAVPRQRPATRPADRAPTPPPPRLPFAQPY